MKIKHFLTVSTFLFFLNSCEKNQITEYRDVKVAVPITMELETLRKSIAIEEPRATEEAGKIYAYKDYIFVNDKGKGVHIIDNSNPKLPVKTKFINIPATVDVAIKDDFLYADSSTDLVVFDLRDMNAIKEVGRVSDVFPQYYPPTPFDIAYVDYEGFDFEREAIIGYTTEIRKEKIPTGDVIIDEFVMNSTTSDSGGNIGQGGSLARFNIVDHYLYTVDMSNLSIFDIQNLENPIALQQEYVGWDIETLFHQGDYLYIGSTTGMIIYDIKDRTSPIHQSTINHLLACDPVVVQGDLAYVTLRGGNLCGQPDSMLEVIDVSDRSNPVVIKTYPMDNPYGLGIKDDVLFVCDGKSGLRIFDATKTPILQQTAIFENSNAIDVIPLKDTLLMIGDDTISQYSYTGNTINLLSTFLLH